MSNTPLSVQPTSVPQPSVPPDFGSSLDLPLDEDVEQQRRQHERLERRLAREFAPLNARALGMALGVVVAVCIALITVLSMLLDPAQTFPLGLLGQLLYGYSVSTSGVLIAALWGMAIGFIGGWLLASGRNVVLSLWMLKVRVQSDVEASHDVLDHI